MRNIPRAILAASLGCAVAVAACRSEDERPTYSERQALPTILIGTGCTGPNSVVVGEEESDFPACERIERHYLPEAGQ